MSADPTHRHDEFHRGLVPEDQLADLTATPGYVVTATGGGAAEWTAAGAGVSEITDIPTAETDTTLRLAPDGAGGVEWGSGGGGTGWPTVYTFDDSSQTDSDPGNGNFRLNHTNASLATKFIVNDFAATNDDLSDWIASWAAEGGALLGYLRLRAVDAPGAFVTYHVTAITDHSGYATVTVDLVARFGTLGTSAGNIAIDFWPTPP